MALAIVYDEIYLEHEQYPGHPENKLRLVHTMDFLRNKGILDRDDVEVLKPIRASIEDLELVHDRDYIELVRRYSELGGGIIDPDTYVSSKTYEVALWSAGGAILGAEKVFSKELDSCFALVRPPGHHAKRHTGAGFCYFNNIAIAAEKLRILGAKRIAIFDWDAHHGDGTHQIFYERSDVLYISIHQDGTTLYPGTGFHWEIGKGEGEGYTINIPMPPGASDKSYQLALDEIAIPILEQYKPDIILVSAGFDPHFSDPLTGLMLTSGGFAMMAERLLELSRNISEKGLFLVLEGGYSTRVGLPYSIANVIKVLLGEEDLLREPISDSVHDRALDDVRERIKRYKDEFSRYWDL